MERRQVTDPEQAEAAGFRGSPTVLVDGREPFATRTPRVCPAGSTATEAGLTGAPNVEQLVAVLS